jgi:hypothetical protein
MYTNRIEPAKRVIWSATRFSRLPALFGVLEQRRVDCWG